MKAFYLTVMVCVLCFAPAAMSAPFEDSFGDNNVLTLNTLQATIAAAPGMDMPAPAAVTGGNRIGGDAFSGAVGVITINQNTGTAIQQSVVNVRIGELTLR